MLLIALGAIWIFLAFFLTRPSTNELTGFSKSFVEWVISSDKTKISSESITLFVDNENYRDRLVLKNTAIIKKNNNENYGDISEIQVRFNARSLIQRFYTPIDLVISEASILLKKDASSPSDPSSKPLDNIFEYFVTMIEKGVFDFKSIGIVNLKANFLSGTKKELATIEAAQIAVNENDNKVYGKVFYEFNKLKHFFDLVASYQDSRYFKINSSFTKLPLHLILDRTNNDLLNNFQHDKNFLEISGNIEHFLDRKLQKYQNKLNIKDANGILYLPDSNSEFLKIDQLSTNIDFSESWISIKDFLFKVNNTQSLLVNSDIHGNEINTLSVDLKNFPISIYKFLKDFESVKDIYEFLDDATGSGFVTGNISASLLNDFLINQKFEKSFIKSNLALSNVQYSYDKDFLPITQANAISSITNDDFNLSISSAKMGGSKVSNGKISFKLSDLINKKNYLQITANAKGPSLDLISFVPKNQVESLHKSDIDLAQLGGEAETAIKLEISPHPDIKTKYDVKSKISGAFLDIFDRNISIKHMDLDGTFDGNSVNFSGTGKINHQKSKLEYSYLLDDTKEYDNMLKITMDLAPSHHTEYSSAQIAKGSGSLNFELISKNGAIKYNTIANLDNLEFIIDKIGLIKPMDIKSDLSFNGNITDAGNSGILQLQSHNGIDIRAKIQFLPGGLKINADKVKYSTTDISAEYLEMKHHAKLNITGDNIDLSSANLFKIMNKESSKKSSDISLNVKNVLLKNGINLNKFHMNISCNKHKCIKGNIDGIIDNNDKEYFKMWISESNNQEIWSIESNNAGKIISSFDVSNTVKNGVLKMQIGTARNLNDLNKQISITKGQFELQNFITTNNTVALKMLSFLSFPGLTSSIMKNDIAFNSMKSKFEYSNNTLTLSNGTASGNVLDFTFQGLVDTEKREYKIKGRVIPSLFGINAFVNWLLTNAPGVSKFLSYGKRKGLLMAPYRISEKY
jgi:hypothetical protein